MPYTDIFDFISTRVDPSAEISDVRDSILVPKVPATYRGINPVNETTGDPQSIMSTLADKIAKLPDNREAYKYTDKQESRYSNPNLQFTPYNIFGTDTEDVYGRFQSGWDQLGNALLKTGANALGTFTSSFLTIPSTLDLIRSGKFIEAFENDSMFSSIQDSLTALEDKLPNYYTQWERDNPYLSAIYPSGMANFWGDKLLKNIGFSIGALGAGLVQDALIELATAGTFTPATSIMLMKQLQKFKSNMFQGFRNVIKGADNIDDALDATKGLSSFHKGLEVSALSDVKTLGKFATITYLNAQGESFIEGYHNYLDTKQTLLEGLGDMDKVDPTEFSKIEKLAQDAGRYTTGLNIPIIAASNLLQFPNLLYGRGLFGTPSKFIKIQFGEKGLEAVSNFSTKKAVLNWAKESFKDAFSEGMEEAQQYHISNSVHDYYVDRMNPKLRKSLAEFVLKNVPDSLADDQFWEEAFIGGMVGFLMGAPASIPTITQGRSRSEALASHLNNSYSRFNGLVQKYSHAIDLSSSDAERNGIASHDSLFSTVHESMKYGTYETFVESIKDLASIEVQKFNEAFNTEFETLAEKNGHLNQILADAKAMSDSIKKTARVFNKNPYTSNQLARKIKEAFSTKTETELNNIQENLFNDFRELAARNESLLNRTNGRILNHKENLKALGVKDEGIVYLSNLTRSPKGLSSYMKFKTDQIKDLERQVKYYEELGKSDVKLSNDPKKELKKAKKVHADTLAYFERLTDLYTKFEEDPKDEAIRRKIEEEVIEEETTEDQRFEFMERRLEELKKLQEQEENKKRLDEEKVDMTKGEDSKTAEELIEVNEAAQEQNQVPVESSEVSKPKTDPNAWIKDYSIGSNITHRNLTVIEINADHIIAQDSKGINYKIIQRVQEDGSTTLVIKPTSPEGLAALGIDGTEVTESELPIPKENIADFEDKIKEIEEFIMQPIDNLIFDAFGAVRYRELLNGAAPNKKPTKLLFYTFGEYFAIGTNHTSTDEIVFKLFKIGNNGHLATISKGINGGNWNIPTEQSLKAQKKLPPAMSAKEVAEISEMVAKRYSDEYSSPEDIIATPTAPQEEVLAKVDSDLAVETETYTLSDVKIKASEMSNYPNTLWTPKGLESGIIYEVASDGKINKRSFEDQVISKEILEVTENSKDVKKDMEMTQVLRPDELPARITTEKESEKFTTIAEIEAARQEMLKTKDAEKWFNFIDRIPQGTLISEKVFDGRLIIPKKKIGKSGAEIYALVTEAYNEETGNWEATSATVFTKKPNGEITAEPIEIFNNAVGTNSQGERVIYPPTIRFPIDEFVGDDKHMKLILQAQIDRKKFELIC